MSDARTDVSKELRRHVGRTLEWFIVGQMAKKLPPEERFFLLYEVSPGKKTHDPRIERARKHHGRGGFCIGDYTLVTVDRPKLSRVLGSPEWFAERLDRASKLALNEARCVVLRDDVSTEPLILIFNARAVHRPSVDPDPTDG